MSKITSSVGNMASSLLGSALGGSSLTAKKPYNTSLSINGNNIAEATVKGDKISTSYTMPEAEKALYDYSNENILSGLENINVFSDDLKDYIQKQVKAYTNQGIRAINENYNPMFSELKNDIASRFGNLDNSVFIDKLNSIEKNRTNALETLTENILAKQSELYDNELDNRYNYLNTLLKINDIVNSNALEMLKLATSNSKV